MEGLAKMVPRIKRKGKGEYYAYFVGLGLV